MSGYRSRLSRLGTGQLITLKKTFNNEKWAQKPTFPALQHLKNTNLQAIQPQKKPLAEAFSTDSGRGR